MGELIQFPRRTSEPSWVDFTEWLEAMGYLRFLSDPRDPKIFRDAAERFNAATRRRRLRIVKEHADRT